MTSAFNKLMGGLDEVESYLSGSSEGFQVHVPDAVDVKSIRQNLHMTQAGFSKTFGFSLDAVKHWEANRRTPEVAARAYLTVIARRRRPSCRLSPHMPPHSKPAALRNRPHVRLATPHVLAIPLSEPLQRQRENAHLSLKLSPDISGLRGSEIECLSPVGRRQFQEDLRRIASACLDVPRSIEAIESRAGRHVRVPYRTPSGRVSPEFR